MGNSNEEEVHACFLAKAKMCKHFDEECMEIVGRLFSRIKEFPKGGVFQTEDEASPAMFMLCQGWAARVAYMVDGSSSITELFVPGDLFPIRAVMSDHKSADRIVALMPCTVAACKVSEVEAATFRSSNFARTLWWLSQRDIGILRTWLAINGQQSAYARVSHLICELHLRLHQVGRAANDEFDWPLTQQDLGNVVGLTPVHINRTLQEMRRDGLITLTRSRIGVADQDGLEQAAGFEGGYLAPD